MFSFLNRTKNPQPPPPPQPSSTTADATTEASTNGAVSASASETSVVVSNGSKASGVEINGNGEHGGSKIASAQIEAHLNDIRKNLLEAILLKRTDIVVSLINEWFKEHKNSSDEGIKYFFNTNYCENGTSSPLLVAYSLKEKDIVRTLLNFGADPSLKELKSHQSLIDMIREADADPSMVHLVSDCFMQAIVQANVAIIKQYLRAGFDLNVPSSASSLPDANSYLHWAAMYANDSVVRLLIEHGAHVNAVNKQGASALHEAILRKGNKEEQMRIIETLLVHKADAIHIKSTSHDQNALEMAAAHADPDVFALIRDFVADLSSMTSASSVPASPLPKSPTPTNALAKNDSSSSLSPNSKETSKTRESIDNSSSDHMNNWVQSQQLNSDPSANELKSLLWPRPQIVTLLGDPTAADSEKFFLSNVKHQPLYIYFRPPHTYAYMDVVNKLASAFSGLVFYCIHKPVDEPHICVSIDESAFRRHDEYSILVTNKKILISAANSVALQYAFFTFMQLCKIYARHAIPALRIIDYSDVKYRSVLFDFSQGFYFKYENLLAVLQMLAFYKINQVHFYVKFSSLPPASLKKQWYHYIHNWFGLMKFCEEVNIQIVPSIDISNDVAELLDVLTPIKEYLDLFKGASKFINIGPRLSSLLTCMENKNPFGLDSSQSMMLCSYLFHNGDAETNAELDKFDRYVLMEYGLKSGADFASKANNLYKSGLQYFYCIGNSNWNSLLGCPDGFLHNLYDAIDRQPIDQPIGLLLCNFIGSLNKNPFAFNLNSMVMFAGASWNSSITMNEIKKNIPLVLLSHGLINDKDGEIGNVMFELGHLETFLTRKSVNSKNFLDLPYDEGSIFVRLLNTPDEVDLDALDKHIFRKSLFHLRAQQSKLKSLLTPQVSVLFKEVSISAEIAFHLFKFLITLYNTGTRHQTANKAVGLNVINIGVANLTQTVRTDLANKLLILKEEYKQVLEQIYFKESIEEHVENFYSRLIDQLLADQVDSNMIELASIKSRQQKAKEQQSQKLLRSVSTSSSQSAYFVDYSNDESNHHLLLKK